MNTDELIRINRLEILSFFDESPTDASRHANSMTAIAGEDLGAGLMQRYFKHSVGVSAKVLSGSCIPGTKSGGRLDRWIEVYWSDETVLYQTEIKNWSANSLGGKRLPVDATHEQIAAHKRERWSRVWDADSLALRIDRTRKVLTLMKSLRAERVEPVLCMWDAMHPDGSTEPWFCVDLKDHEHFRHFWVFSMSGYLRTLQDDYLYLTMPDTARRLTIANSLFQPASPN